MSEDVHKITIVKIYESYGEYSSDLVPVFDNEPEWDTVTTKELLLLQQHLRSRSRGNYSYIIVEHVDKKEIDVRKTIKELVAEAKKKEKKRKKGKNKERKKKKRERKKT